MPTCRKLPLGLKPVPVPADNPLTPEKVELGKQLYFDPRLSCDDTVSCASCHDPKKGWSNGDAVRHRRPQPGRRPQRPDDHQRGL